MSEDPDTDYSYPLVYAFEAPSDKEGTYENRKSVSNLIRQSYVLDNVDKKDNDNTIVDAILGIKMILSYKTLFPLQEVKPLKKPGKEVLRNLHGMERNTIPTSRRKVA